MKPTKCIETKPNKASLYFGGEFISLTQLSVHSHVDRSYISYIMSGKRDPNLRIIRALAAALGLTTAEFIDNLESYQLAPKSYAA